jgi:hypothetical protein
MASVSVVQKNFKDHPFRRPPVDIAGRLPGGDDPEATRVAQVNPERLLGRVVIRRNLSRC